MPPKKNISATSPSAAPKKGPKQLSNPRSTGGAGPSYENRVQATYLLAHLSGESTAILPNARVVGLQFQARVLGYHTDDLVCTLLDLAGRERKVLLQVKQTLKATPSNDAFNEALTGAWYDVHNPDIFNSATDRIAVVFDGDGDSNVQGATAIAEFARTSRAGSDFYLKIFSENFSNQTNRNAYGAVERVVADIVEGPVDPETIRCFCRSLWFVSHRLTNDTTPEFADVLSRIGWMLGGSFQTSPHAVWNSLVAACSRLNQVAAALTFENLDEQVDPVTAAAFSRHRNSGAARLSMEGTAQTTVKDAPQASTRTFVPVPTAGLNRLGSGVALPAGRPDAANKVIAGQLDAVNEKLKSQRYEDALGDLATLGKDMRPFDDHQRARWHLQRGVAYWHLGDTEPAAEDFLAAAKLSDDDDKMAAAYVRGLLLQQRTAEAVSAGRAARARFPDSEHVWLVWANAQLLAGGTIEQSDAPYTYREGCGVYQMLAWGRRLTKDFPGALEYSKKSLEASDANFYTRHDALALAVEAATTSGVNSTYRLITLTVRAALVAASQAFEPRQQRLWTVQAPKTTEAAATHLGYAYLLLGEPDKALAMAQEASARGLSAATLHRVEVDALAEMGNTAGLKERGRALMAQLDEPGLVSLAQAASHAGDLELVDLAIEAAINVPHSRADTMATLNSIRWMGMYLSPLREKAVAEVRAVGLDETTPYATLLAVCRILFKEKDIEASKGALDLARAAAAREGVPEATLLLAELLHFTKHYQEAAKKFGEVLPRGQYSELHARWLHALLRAEDRRGAKRLLETFPAGWAEDDYGRSLATELAQSAGDWPLLKTLSEAQTKAAPHHASSVLFAFMVAQRLEPVAAIVELLADLPIELEGTIQQVSQVAVLEMRYGQAVNGMRRLYRLRRLNLENIEAASALMLAYGAAPDDLPNMEEFLPSVTAGASVRLRDTEGNEIWLSIDPTEVGGLSESSEFKSASNASVISFVGKCVGDAVSTPVAFGQSRIWAVLGICSVHRRLLRLAEDAINTSLEPVPNALSVPIHRTAEGTDFSGVLAQLKRAGDHSRQAFQTYASHPITLGGLAKMLHRSPVVLGAGWPTDGHPLYCCDGSEPEISAGMALLRDADASFVIDSATLSELAVIGCLDVLKTLPKVLVCVRSREEVVSQLEEAKDERGSLTAFENEGKLGVVEITPDDRARHVAFLQSIVDAIDAHAELVPAYGPAEVHPFLNLVKRGISDEEYSMLLVASERGAHLFTTDGRLRAWAAKAQIRGVWPQLVLMAAREAGRLSTAAYSQAVARLFLANRNFVMMAGPDMAMLCQQGTAWLEAGISRFKQCVSSAGIKFDSALNTTFEFLRILAADSTTNGAFSAILEHVAEGLARSPYCPPDLARRFEIMLSDMIAPRDIVYCYRPAALGAQVEANRAANYLAPFLARGLARARLPAEPRLVNVKVLMVSRTPWLQKAEAATSGDESPVPPFSAQDVAASEKSSKGKKHKTKNRAKHHPSAPSATAQGHRILLAVPLAPPSLITGL